MKRTYKLLSMLLAVAMLFSAISKPASAAPNDVQGHWGKDAINYCLDRGYMKGVGNNTFQPNGSVTRAQVVQVLYNMSGSPNTASLPNPFTDSQNHWAKNAIKWAKSTGVVKGVSTTAFAPDQQVTRDQVTTMFMRYAEQDTSNSNNDFILDSTVLNRFSDRDKVASWYLKGVTWAVQYGFMQGSGGKLNPTGVLTRAQLAQFIKNYYEPLGGTKPTPAPVPTVDPISTPVPTATPTTQPTVSPTTKPTVTPTTKPTVTPTTKPTVTPTVKPTATPKPTPTPLPYVANSLARTNIDPYRVSRQITLDKDDNIIYCDTKEQKIFRLNRNNDGWSRPEMILNIDNVPHEMSTESGKKITYKNIKVDQVFYDKTLDRLLLVLTFSEIDSSATGGWTDPKDPDKLTGTFVLENSQLTYLSNNSYPFLCALSDGRYVMDDMPDTLIWDPVSDIYSSRMEVRNGSYHDFFMTVEQMGQELYGMIGAFDESYENIAINFYQYDYAQNCWKFIKQRFWISAAYHDGASYIWDSFGTVTAYRPSGETKEIMDVTKDVMVSDFNPLPNPPTNLLLTSDGIFVFYDINAKAIRAIYPNPALSGSDPTKKYQTLEEYYNDPEIWSLLENKFKDIETPIYIDSEDNEMYIDFVYSEDELAGVELEKLAKQLEQELDVEFFDDLINDIAAKVDVVDPALYISHWTYDDELIYGVKFIPD